MWICAGVGSKQNCVWLVHLTSCSWTESIVQHIQVLQTGGIRLNLPRQREAKTFLMNELNCAAGAVAGRHERVSTRRLMPEPNGGG